MLFGVCSTKILTLYCQWFLPEWKKATIQLFKSKYILFYLFIYFLFQVRNPDKYNWDPKWLLSHLVDIYLHLDSETLAAAMANDQRSFSIELFKDATSRVQKNLSRSQEDIAKFQKLAEKAQEITLANLKKDEDYEDAPDEFIGNFLISRKKIYVFSCGKKSN